jgi:ABC-type glycerol-3-phosphate transport system substrate-binding protein
MLLAYREDVYKKNNIKVPQTWTEYLEAAKKINNKDGVNAVTIMGKRGQPIFSTNSCPTFMVLEESSSTKR